MKMMKMRWAWLYGGALVLVGSALALGGCVLLGVSLNAAVVLPLLFAEALLWVAGCVVAYVTI